LLVTDITQLSSIMFLASEPAFEQVIQLPVQDEHIYYMKNIVSRKKQLIPLLTEMLEGVEQ
ncbi:MAG: inorganic diphosphatase, partial [Treponema sp.]|nr:inorganic diphosphatase [Treponema sp.]